MLHGSHEGKSGNMVLTIAKYDLIWLNKLDMQNNGELWIKHGKYD